VFPPTPSSTANDDAVVIDVCWGLSPERSHSAVTTSRNNQAAFSTYVTSGGFLSDAVTLCDHLDTHRSEYLLPAWWNHTRDCLGDIYHVYSEENNGRNMTQSSLLSAWASDTIADMFGAEKSTGTSAPSLTPQWICANMTVTSSATLTASETMDLSNKWNDLVKEYGSRQASIHGVSVVVAAKKWSMKLLEYDLEKILLFVSIMISLFVPVCILLFSWNIVLSTLYGLFWIVLLTSIFLLKSVLFEKLTINQYDIYSVLLCGGLLAFNPCYLLWTYYQRDQVLKNDGIIETQRHDVLQQELRRMKLVLAPPAVAAVVVGVPLLFSNIELCSRCGRAIIISAVLSMYMSLMVVPLLMTLSCGENSRFLVGNKFRYICHRSRESIDKQPSLSCEGNQEQEQHQV